VYSISLHSNNISSVYETLQAEQEGARAAAAAKEEAERMAKAAAEKAEVRMTSSGMYIHTTPIIT
jgi:hypothetical protein